MSWEWHDRFLDLLKERGYEDVEIWHDSVFGWTVNYGEGEFDALTTADVQARIKALPLSAESSPACPADPKEQT